MSERMDPDVKAKWITALRSGKYRQGTGALHNLTKDEFCCLGVLCDLAVQADVEVVDGVVGDDYATYDGEASYLPLSVRQWAGLFQKNPWVGPDVTLAQANDRGTSYEEIAALIKEYL
jgi:hypothetical protein